MVRGMDIEISGGLVGQQNAWRIGDSARDGDTLLLATRKLRWPMGQDDRPTEIFKQFGCALDRLAPRQAADHLRHDDIFKGRELRQQVMELIDEAYLVSANSGAFAIGQPEVGRPSI